MSYSGDYGSDIYSANIAAIAAASTVLLSATLLPHCLRHVRSGLVQSLQPIRRLGISRVSPHTPLAAFRGVTSGMLLRLQLLMSVCDRDSVDGSRRRCLVLVIPACISAAVIGGGGVLRWEGVSVLVGLGGGFDPVSLDVRCDVLFWAVLLLVW